MLVLDGANNALACPVHSLGRRDVLIPVWLLPMFASPADHGHFMCRKFCGSQLSWMLEAMMPDWGVPTAENAGETFSAAL